jgi:hypothetical protein
VADIAVSRTLRALKAAGNPVRLGILPHAAANRDHIRPADAKPYMNSSRRTSTVQYHFRRLVDALLLERVGWGEYRLTDAGRQVSRLARLLADDVAEHADREERDHVAERSLSLSLLAEGAVAQALDDRVDLVAELTQTLRAGRVETSRLRLLRSNAP